MTRADALLERDIDAAVRAHGCVRPPWIEFPDHARFTSFWYMGAGEWHTAVWTAWWEGQPATPASRLEYFRRFPPPTRWLDWAATAVWPALDGDGDAVDEAVRRLESAGLGSFEAWSAWMSG